MYKRQAWWDEENNGFMESRKDYADPTREIAEETGCKFIDENKIVTDAVSYTHLDVYKRQYIYQKDVL